MSKGGVGRRVSQQFFAQLGNLFVAVRKLRLEGLCGPLYGVEPFKFSAALLASIVKALHRVRGFPQKSTGPDRWNIVGFDTIGVIPQHVAEIERLDRFSRQPPHSSREGGR